MVGNINSVDVDAYLSTIKDGGTETPTRLRCAQELRDSIEGWKDQDATRFVTTGLKSILNILRSEGPVFTKETTECQLRQTLLQIVNRTPLVEALKEISTEIIDVMLFLVTNDNEDIGMLAVKTFMELSRNFRITTETQAASFIKQVEKMYGNMEQLVQDEFSTPNMTQKSSTLKHSMKSFKVLSECPMIVVLIMQLHRHLVNQTVRTMLPIHIMFLKLQAMPQVLCHEEARVNGSIWVGVAPELHGNQSYRDLILAQVKTVFYLAFIIRGANESLRQYQDTLPDVCVRLLMDCPPEATGIRKDLMLATRHILATDIRQAFVAKLDLLLTERILLGPNLATQETLRPLAYTMLADMIHHVRADLTPNQLSRVIRTYSAMLHNTATSGSFQTMCAKLLSTMTESVIAKHSREGAAEALYGLLECIVQKLQSVSFVQEELRKSKEQRDSVASSYITLEKAKPIYGAAFVLETTEEVLKESRLLFRTLLYGTRSIITSLRQIEAVSPNAEVLGRFFEGAIRCLALFRDMRDETEAMNLFASLWYEVNPHVFQETWTTKLNFFLDCSVNHPALLTVAQTLFENEYRSRQLVALALRYFCDRLDDLGRMEARCAAVTLRFTKLAFGAVAQFTEANESTLTKHVERLIMGSFPLAAKYPDSNNYFLLLKALFRAIGGGQGKFELLYKEVLPLLPEMLESLSKMLSASDYPSVRRDLLIELSLTVPVRLAHLLKFLHYLMKPLVLALQGSSELVTQGLRTLELMVDNLTAEFLDPALQPVLRELMDSLTNHLKPVPVAPHQHSHTIIRILGKLGGRNRRLLERHPNMQFNSSVDAVNANLSMGGRLIPFDISSYVELAVKSLKNQDLQHRASAFELLKCCTFFLLSTVSNREVACFFQLSDGTKGLRDVPSEGPYVNAFKALLDALHIPDLQARALDTIRSVLQQSFALENKQSRESGLRRLHNSPLNLFIMHLPGALMTSEVDDTQQIREFVSTVVQDILELVRDSQIESTRPRDPNIVLHRLAARFTALCYQPDWKSKAAGFAGIGLMTNGLEVGLRLTLEREIEVVRALLFVLKDMPHDAPRNSDEVFAVLNRVIRTCNSNPMNPDSPEASIASGKLLLLTTILLQELPSQHSTVRSAAQSCLIALADSYGKTLFELLAPYKDRLLTSIYSKPLRALPLASQIGYIDAMTYCLSVNPPLAEVNDDFTRLLQEVLGMALGDNELEDEVIGPGGTRTIYRQNVLINNELRVAYIKFFNAAMPITDLLAKQPNTRQRVTAIYFKSLYSAVPAVKQVANDGLRIVLSIQSRLPKDLLQTGLRPILMNLADPKKLSVAGLEGLARLLALLTNYFKVEIGTKLLDHFRILADPSMLRESVFIPLGDNEEIKKLVKLVNIFHLLPPSAGMFLEELVRSVVKVEAQLQLSGPNPFTEPLAKYLNLHAYEGVDCFLAHLNERSYVQTLCNILRSRQAPVFASALMGRSRVFVQLLSEESQSSRLQSTLAIILELANLSLVWLFTEKELLFALLENWSSGSNPIADSRRSESLVAILQIFCKVISVDSRIDLVFDIFAKFPDQVGGDLSFFTRFLCTYLYNLSSLLKRNILLYFTVWYDYDIVTDDWRAMVLRNVVTPLIQMVVSSEDNTTFVLDIHIFEWFHKRIWHPMSESSPGSEANDALNIELLNLCSIMVCHCWPYMQDARKDIIKCAWNFICSEDAVVKQCAYLLAVRFFEVFDSPPKFILRALTGLLRPGQAEIRLLIKQALDILVPILPKRLGQEVGVPQWAKLIRRIMMDDSQGQSQLVIIYQMIVRHRDLFYPSRELFIPQLIQALAKLIITTPPSLESRILLLDIVETIWSWEKQARLEPNGAVEHSQDTMDVDVDPSSSSSGVLVPSQQELVVSHLVRLVVAHPDVSTRSVLVNRSLGFLTEMLEPRYWGEVEVKLMYFSRAFDQPDKEGISGHLQNCVKVLDIVTQYKTDDWFTGNAETLQEILQKTISRDDPSLIDSIYPLLERLIRLFPLPNQEEESQFETMHFHSFAAGVISEGLRSGNNLYGALILLKIVIRVDPTRIEPYASSTMRMLAKFTKEHVGLPGPNSPAYEVGVRMLLSILEISRLVVGYLGDQRKVLLTSLIQLIERSSNSQLCPTIMDIVRDWILNRKDIYPTLKEKAGLVQKMQSYERLSGSLFDEYLDLVYSIYTDSSLRRTDLTVRLEQSFLIGCRSRNWHIRQKFTKLLDASIPKGVIARLTFILGVQNWEPLADQHWLFLALDLIFSSIDSEVRMKPGNMEYGSQSGAEQSNLVVSRDLIEPSRELLFLHPEVVHEVWVDLFPSIWSNLNRREQADISHHLLVLFSKEYHVRQAGLRPNVIQTLLCGIRMCAPPISLPPHLLKYLGRTFGAWHIAMELLQSTMEHIKDDEQSFESTHDALVELYADLAEEDMFYGSWRRRSLFPEANAALSFEQNGMWQQAQNLYEAAQNRSRNGIHPFSEVEFELWEDHWILAAQKLQQWDVLMDLAKSEGNHDLFLECAWRLLDWNSEANTIEEHLLAITDIQTPRRKTFEALAILSRANGNVLGADFSRVIDDAMQLSLRKWSSLPPVISLAHVPVLQHFQQVLELQEAAQIFASLSSTTASSLEKKSSEMKHILQAWRERLPNLGDDITIWSDLVSWRQHVFTAINRFFSPFIAPTAQGNATSNNSSTIGYRGYHETAWITNRFAHVARKHYLIEVCHNSLNKIYTLPNIEISEAFLKLREQARCYYQSPSDLHLGMDVINNTNLMYFSNPQKAEFYTLKAMFFTKLGSKDDANRAFASAVQMDMTLAKAWAEWGKFGDRTFQENPSDVTSAASAVSCYLQAAGLYKSAKSRPLLIRILWLLSVDDGTLAVSRAFDTYKGEAALWYWITLVPQLLISLSHREAKHARYILLNLAKLFPQALFFQLRTSKEEMVALKRSASARQQQQQTNGIAADGVNNSAQTSTPPSLRQPFEYLEEIVNILKTAFPLLALTMETFVDQIHTRFKATPDEDAYRFTSILLTEAITAYTQRVKTYTEDGTIPIQCASNAARFSANVAGLGEFEQDVVKPKLTLREHISKLQKWRDRYERVLDLRPRFQPLDLLSHWLVEFHHGKWDDIEVPGQYLEHRDNNSNFVKISRVDPRFEVCRAHGFSFRRLTLHGHDGNVYSFAVQVPSARHARREERLMQLFRIFNVNLARRKETRKRNITFHLPAIVPFNPTLRILENDASYITMQDVYDQRCEVIGLAREEAMLIFTDKIKRWIESKRIEETGSLKLETGSLKLETGSLKLETMTELMSKVTPQSTLTNFMIKMMSTPSDLWTMRKQFGLQISSATFMTYIMCLSARYPSRFHLSRKTGLIHVSEMLPSLSSQQPVFANPETVPFRLTPNMQHFLTPIGVEGLLTVGLMSIGRSLTEPEFEMDQQLSLFLRDEVLTWYNIHQQSPQVDATFRKQVTSMVEGVVRRAESLACLSDKEKDPKSAANNMSAVQTISNLISSATNPIALSQMSENYHAWF